MTSDPDGSSIPPLSDDQRDWIRRTLKSTGVPVTAGMVDRLASLVAGSMDAFRKDVAAQSTDRERHDALRRLLKLVESRDPPIRQIRALIKQLSARSVEDLEERAALIWYLLNLSE
jgi:MoxR-like ATPase